VRAAAANLCADGRAGGRTDVAGGEHGRRRGTRDGAHGRGTSLESLGRLQERKSNDGNRLHVALRTAEAEADAGFLGVQIANWPGRLLSGSVH